ncbi:MAG: hypothetical protein ACLTDX_23595 [[Clostridium] innocuum]
MIFRVIWYENASTCKKGHDNMLLDICKEHRKRYGWLIRQKRIALGYTKELVRATGRCCFTWLHCHEALEKRCRIWIS